MNRREFILGSVALSIAGLSRPAWAVRSPQLKSALDAIAHDVLSHSPELATRLGLDHGEYASARSHLDDKSAAARARTVTDVPRYRKLLNAVKRDTLVDRDATLFDSLLFCLDAADRSTHFAYGDLDTFGDGTPYVLTQQDGVYQHVPEFLDSKHKVEAKADAETYLARAAELGRALDNDTERAQHDAGLGVIPPDFLLDTALEQLKALRAVPADKARLTASLVRRTSEKKIAGDWAARITKIVASTVYPALDRQIAAITALRAKATHDAGVWKLPKGDAYYALRLYQSTSTKMSPEEVHALGLKQGAELDARMDAALKQQGMTQGTVGERLAALSKDPKQLFANTDDGKVAAVAYVQQQMDALRAFLPRVSKLQMKADVVVKRVPPDIEAGAPLGYMNTAALDGSRPAMYYINLRNTSTWPKFTIPSLSAHEGLPGHGWQFAYVVEHTADVPRISSILELNAFSEGWALYAEQLVDELGYYDQDPLGRLGMYQGMRFRAARLVVDTGLHEMKWTREKAVDYLCNATGRARLAVTSEVDRYCASPGQACGYKVGHTEILRLHDKAKAELGAKFDVRDFDDAIVQTGGVPLAVLATVIDDYIKKTKSG